MPSLASTSSADFLMMRARGVKILVDAVAKAHQAEAVRLVLGLVNPLLQVSAIGLDLLQHLNDRLVGATVKRPPQGRDAGRDRRVEVGLRTAHNAHC